MAKYLLFMLLAISQFAMAQEPITYEIDVTKNSDTFFVKLNVPEKLKKENRVFQFSATAPGTYQTQHIGRFVSNFQAFDRKGKVLKVKYIAPNQYRISKPGKVTEIEYQVAETFDTEVENFPVYMMAGSTIEADNALINAHTVFGYFHGKQSHPLKIELITGEGWQTGTALQKQGEYYLANSFDHAVDSPILTGRLSFAETKMADTPIRVFTYSQEGKFNAEELLGKMKKMLAATQNFLVKLPVNEYTFLYYFMTEPKGVTGAWEHSFSSEYVLAENDPSPAYMKQVTDIASHEFFHIVTPLNIHSEIIEHFNFVEPTPSQHLWLYEGLTEWASHILLLRGGVVDINTYLKHSLAQKITISEIYFDPSKSLAEIATSSFTEEGAKQYGNIYYKGALVAGYLDIRLLELSGGKRGLRELMLELVKKYGQGKPFSEKAFFDELVAMTHPEIADFIEKYIKNAEPLPHAEYLAKIGLIFDKTGPAVEVNPVPNPTDAQKALFEVWQKNL